MGNTVTKFILKLEDGDFKSQLKQATQANKDAYEEMGKSTEKYKIAQKSLERVLSQKQRAILASQKTDEQLLKIKKEQLALGVSEEAADRKYLRDKDRINISQKEINKTYADTIAKKKALVQIEKQRQTGLKTEIGYTAQSMTRLKQEISGTKDSIAVMDKKTKSTESLANATIRYLRWAGTIAGVVYAGQRAWQATLGTGIEVNKMMEDNTSGIAALLSANTQMVLSNGQTVNSYEKFAIGQKVAKETMEDLRKASIKTYATFPQLTEIFQQAIGQTLSMGDAMGTTTDSIIDNTVELSQRMSNISGSIGMPMDRAKEEIRSLLSGNASTDSLISTMIFGSPTAANKAIRDAKERGTNGVKDMLDGMLAPFDVLADVNSYTRSLLTLEDAWKNTMAEMSKPVFDDLSTTFKDLADTINENSDDIVKSFNTIYTAGANVISFFGDLGDAIVAPINKMEELKKALLLKTSGKTVGKDPLQIKAMLEQAKKNLKKAQKELSTDNWGERTFSSYRKSNESQEKSAVVKAQQILNKLQREYNKLAEDGSMSQSAAIKNFQDMKDRIKAKSKDKKDTKKDFSSEYGILLKDDILDNEQYSERLNYLNELMIAQFNLNESTEQGKLLQKLQLDDSGMKLIEKINKTESTHYDKLKNDLDEVVQKRKSINDQIEDGKVKDDESGELLTKALTSADDAITKTATEISKIQDKNAKKARATQDSELQAEFKRSKIKNDIALLENKQIQTKADVLAVETKNAKEYWEQAKTNGSNQDIIDKRHKEYLVENAKLEKEITAEKEKQSGIVFVDELLSTSEDLKQELKAQERANKDNLSIEQARALVALEMLKANGKITDEQYASSVGLIKGISDYKDAIVEAKEEAKLLQDVINPDSVVYSDTAKAENQEDFDFEVAGMEFDLLDAGANQEQWDAFYDNIEAVQDKLDTLNFDTLMERFDTFGDALSTFGDDFGSEGISRLGDGFKDVGKINKDMLKNQEKYNSSLLEAGKDEEKIADAKATYAMDQTASAFGMIGASKALFAEDSKAYKAMQAMEMAGHAIKMVQYAIQLPAALAIAKANFLAAINAQGSIPIVGFGLAIAMATLLMSFGSSGGGGGGASMSQTDLDIQSANDQYNPTLDKLDRQIELLEAIDRNGSASALSVTQAGYTFERDYKIFVAEALGDTFSILGSNYGGTGGHAFIQKSEDAVEQALGFNLTDAMGTTRNVVDKDALKEGYNFIKLLESFNTGILADEMDSRPDANTTGAGAYQSMFDKGWQQAGRTGREQYEFNLNKFIGEYQDLISSFTLSIIDSMTELDDASDDFKDIFDGTTGSMFYETKRLEDAFADVVNLKGSGSFADYLTEQIDNIAGLEELLSNENIELLLLEDPTKLEEQRRLVESLEEATSQTFANGARDALDYIESIELVGESMIRSAENIKDWEDGFKNKIQLTEDMADAMGITMATSKDELTHLFNALRQGITGLTDAELEFLETNQSAIDAIEDEFNAKISNALEMAKLKEKLEQEELKFYNDAVDAVRKMSDAFFDMSNSLEDTIANLLGKSDSGDAQDTLIQTFWSKKAEVESLLAKDGDLTDTERGDLVGLVKDIEGLSGNIQSSNIGENTQITNELVSELSYLKDELDFDNKILQANIVDANGVSLDVAQETGVLLALTNSINTYNDHMATLTSTAESDLSFEDFKSGGMLSTADEIAFRQSFTVDDVMNYKQETEDLRDALTYLSLDNIDTKDYLTKLSSANNVAYGNLKEFISTIDKPGETISGKEWETYKEEHNLPSKMFAPQATSQLSGFTSMMTTIEDEQAVKARAFKDEQAVKTRALAVQSVVSGGASISALGDYTSSEAVTLYEGGVISSHEAWRKGGISAEVAESSLSLDELGIDRSNVESYFKMFMADDGLNRLRLVDGKLVTTTQGGYDKGYGIRDDIDYDGTVDDLETLLLRNLKQYSSYHDSNPPKLDDMVTIPSYDIGTTNVPSDMLAQIHKNEMIVPETFNQGLQNGNLTLGNNKDIISAINETNQNLMSVNNRLLKIELSNREIRDATETTAYTGTDS